MAKKLIILSVNKDNPKSAFCKVVEAFEFGAVSEIAVGLMSFPNGAPKKNTSFDLPSTTVATIKHESFEGRDGSPVHLTKLVLST